MNTLLTPINMDYREILNKEYREWMKEVGMTTIYPKNFPEAYIQPVLRAMEQIDCANRSKPIENLEGMPIWLSPGMRDRIKVMWNSPEPGKTRVDCVRFLQDKALEFDVKIGVKKAADIVTKYCL